MKIVINRCFGGFVLSEEAFNRWKAANPESTIDWDREIPRDDKSLIKIIEELGEEASSGGYAKLEIIEIPNNVEWQLEEYDGFEHISEKHRTWPKQ